MKGKKLAALLIASSLLLGTQTAFASTSNINTDKQVTINGYSYPQKAVDAMNYLNSIREKMGLQDVKLDPFLQKAAQNHVNYSVMNGTAYQGLGAHDESPDKKGYTGVANDKRYKAVGGSQPFSTMYEDMDFTDTTGKGAIGAWLNAPYHRAALLDPSVSEIGIGFNNSFSVLESIAMGSTDTFVSYPYDGQTNVPVGFYGHENPNPLAGTGLSESGYIITVDPKDVVDSLDVTLTDSHGNKIPTTQVNDYMYHVIPKQVLEYNEKYTVTVSYVGTWQFVGKHFTHTWSFTTEPKPADSTTTSSTSTYNPQPTGSFSATDPSQYSVPTQTPTQTPTPKFGENNVGVKVNGQLVTLTPPAKILNGSTFIPLRGVFEKMSATLKWHGDDKSIDIVKGDITVHLQIGNKTALINGTPKQLSIAPFISKEGSTYVPLRFASESLNAKVGWMGQDYIATIDTK